MNRTSRPSSGNNRPRGRLSLQMLQASAYDTLLREIGRSDNNLLTYQVHVAIGQSLLRIGTHMQEVAEVVEKANRRAKLALIAVRELNDKIDDSARIAKVEELSLVEGLPIFLDALFKVGCSVEDCNALVDTVEDARERFCTKLVNKLDLPKVVSGPVKQALSAKFSYISSADHNGRKDFPRKPRAFLERELGLQFSGYSSVSLCDDTRGPIRSMERLQEVGRAFTNLATHGVWYTENDDSPDYVASSVVHEYVAQTYTGYEKTKHVCYGISRYALKFAKIITMALPRPTREENPRDKRRRVTTSHRQTVQNALADEIREMSDNDDDDDSLDGGDNPS